MKHCVECQGVIKQPRRAPICERCYEKMLVYRIKNEDKKESEVTK